MSAQIPKEIEKLVWSQQSDLDLEKDKTVVIHHVLSYGRIEDIRWFLQAYPTTTIKQTFTQSPLNVYSKASYHFAKSAVLNIQEKFEDEHRYIQSFH